MDKTLNTIQLADCIASMNALPEGSIDLSFADPPFNIGYDYDVYKDKVGYHEYLDWSRKWIGAVHRVLKPDGTFWLTIGDEYAAELKLLSQEIGFHCRSWVVWYYTFGVNCKSKFTRSHAHMFYFVKDPDQFTFRDEDLDNRVPSARELVYNDKRANPLGRLPDDTWIIRPADVVGELTSDDDGTWSPDLLDKPSDTDRTFILRPQDVEASFKADEDTWYIPRVAGTFKERAGFHGCQMPEQLLGRIIRTCSEEGDVVLDPFSGSATTLAVAKKLGRRFIGYDISKDYVEYGRKRLESIRVGDQLDGSAEPTKSAPKTNDKRGTKQSAKSKAQQELAAKETRHNQIQLQMTLHGITEAFEATHGGFSADRVVADPQLNREFTALCERIGLVGDARTWNTLLLRLRKAGKLSDIDSWERTTISWEDLDGYLFASEIAWQQMIDEGVATSLDDILCDPKLAAKFDELAGRLAPGFSSFEYRWAALKLRKEANMARGRGQVLTPPTGLGKSVALSELKLSDLPDEPGVYVLSERDGRELYAGETRNLRDRLTLGQQQAAEWSRFGESIRVQTYPLDPAPAGNLAWQCCLVSRNSEQRPKLNYAKLRSE